MVDEDIDLSFGGSAGHDDFRDMLLVDPGSLSQEFQYEEDRLREERWADLEEVLRLGGQFQDGGETFLAPYTWTYELSEGMDAFETFFVIASGVALRDRPIRFGEVIRRLDYDVVQFIDWIDGTGYSKVRLSDGTEGYVFDTYLRAHVDFRAIFRKQDGEWKMTVFIAGD